MSAAAFFGQGFVPGTLHEAAWQVTIRLQFLLQWDNEGIERQTVLDLFDLRYQGEGAARQSARAHRHPRFESLPIGQLEPARPSTEGIECHNADPDAQPQAWCYRYHPGSWPSTGR